MNNLQFLVIMNWAIAQFIDDSNFYIYIPAFTGYHNGMQNGMFIKINEKLFDYSDTSIYDFFTTLPDRYTTEGTAAFIEGYHTFVFNEDYFLSEALGNIVAEEYDRSHNMPNYINQFNMFNKDAYYDLSNMYNKDLTNLQYFYNKNIIHDSGFTEDDIDNFYATFASIIYPYCINADMNEIRNVIYDRALLYLKFFMSDPVLTGMDLILNNSVTTTTNNTGGCGCSSDSLTSGTSDLANASCTDLYKSAMLAYIKQMLGDYNFYCDWFMNKNSGVPEDILCDTLIKLIQTLLDANYSLDFSEDGSTSVCGCPAATLSEEDRCTRLILENYIKVLNWVKTNDIDANVNKIKIYGEAFGEILPKLIFTQK